ncbi:MAG TPA: rhomboid family intramembrane serine protease [Terriglobales bacterium]|nr:rhomboid family intramembrane serine protease [Terriglobales bacterium]
MLLPIRHEGMTARRWPLITFALIALNVICFVPTYSTMQDDMKKVGEVKAHILLMAASHPELTFAPEAQQLVEDFKKHDPDTWAQVKNENRDVIDAWDAKMRLEDDPAQLQEDLDSLTSQYDQLTASSIAEQYAFIPAHPKPITYITANFLHGGWLHLIGNMWFLWLAGFVLEDVWGRPLYAVFYLIAGVAALQFHAWTNPGSTVPTLGASGAVAALMGAFLVRFPKMKIEMLWLFGFRLRRFKAPAVALLPLWLIMEVFYGTLFGHTSGVAHWAHVGGFAFGALGALGLRYSGLESKANQKIEQDLTLESDTELQQASNLIDQGQLDSATAILNQYLATKSDSVDAYNLLWQVHQKRSDQAGSIEASNKLCAIYLKAGEDELAWKSYENFLNSGGQHLTPSIWLDICRAAEKLAYYDRALSEYDELARTFPSEKQSIPALIGAARICLKRLNQPERALELFETASKSAVPHLDWEQSIEAGVREAKTALAKNAGAASAGH